MTKLHDIAVRRWQSRLPHAPGRLSPSAEGLSCAVTPDEIDIPTRAPQFTGLLYKPAGTATAGLGVIAYGTDGFVDTERGPWKKMINGYAEDLAARGVFALIP